MGYEIVLSQLFLRRSWRIRGLLPEYDALDLNEPHTNPNPATPRRDDLSYRHAYFGRSLHPYEVIFIKSNRDLHPTFLLDLLTHSMACAANLPPERRFLDPDVAAAMAVSAGAGAPSSAPHSTPAGLSGEMEGTPPTGGSKASLMNRPGFPGGS